MSIIQKTILFKGSKGEAKIATMFDSGASYSCIRKDIAEKMANLEKMPEEMVFGTADNDTYITANYAVRLNFYLNQDRFSDEFIVLDNLSEEIIIGVKTLQSWRMQLDFEHDEIIYDPKVTHLKIVALC